MRPRYHQFDRGEGVDLHHELQSIATKDDLAKFLTLLHNDLKTNPDAWENVTLDSFLEAMHAWVLDSEALRQKTGIAPESPTWRTFAEILSAARIYE